MKKIFAMFLFALTAVSVFAGDYVFPGWKCTDLAKIDAAIAASETTESKTAMQILRVLAGQPPASFDELCAAVDQAVDNVSDPAVDAGTKALWKLRWKKQFAYNRQEFLPETLAFCKAHPSMYDIYIAMAGERYSMTGTEIYTPLVSCLIKYPDAYSAYTVRSAVKKLVAAAVTAEVKTQKSDLEKLNRIYSIKAIENPSGWTPVVSMIRTAMATY